MGKNAGQLPKGLGKQEASRLIGAIAKRRDAGLCTMSQLYALKKHGIDASGFKFAQASRVMDALSRNRWQPLTNDALGDALRGGR